MPILIQFETEKEGEYSANTKTFGNNTIEHCTA